MISISFKSIDESILNNSSECFFYLVPFFEEFDKSELKNLKFPYLLTEKEVACFIKSKNFCGKEKEFCSLNHFYSNKLNNIIFGGLGKINANEIGYLKERLRCLVGLLIRYVENNKISSLNIILPEINFIDSSVLSEIISSTVIMSSYEFNEYITNKNRKAHNNYLCFISSKNELRDSCNIGIERGLLIGNSVNNARRWGDLPPSVMYPKIFSDEASKLLSELNNIKLYIIEKNNLEELGMGGILGVSKGSEHNPYLFIAEYTPNKDYKKTIALVGKGVTFDTGGISIKPSDNMEDMKNDMAGAATVLSSIYALSKLNSPYRIIAAAAMVENMPDGKAIKPGDILTFYNKKTAEIKNTDAEGRLILADALSYVSDKYKPDIMIDIATLTGACCVALGPIFAAVMGKNEDLISSIKKAGIESGDRCWELPLDDNYKKAVDSDVADLCNIGKSRYKAGTITAGWFLKSFVSEEINWAHIDIASMSSHAVEKPYLRSNGATGFGVKLCIELLESSKYF